ARIDLAERCHKFAETRVLGQIGGSEGADDRFLITTNSVASGAQQTIGENAAQRRLKLMVVRIDESRHNNHAGCVHHDGRIENIQVPADRYDLFPPNEYVALLEVPDVRIHTEDDSVLEQDGAPIGVHKRLQSSTSVLCSLTRHRGGQELHGSRT